MSCWWRESANCYIDLSKYCAISFKDEQFKLLFCEISLKNEFVLVYDNETSYNEAKNKIIELMGY